MERLTFIDTTTGKEYERIISTRVAADPEKKANKVNVLKTAVAQEAITDEWRKIHEYAHTGRASDVWKDKEDSLKWYAEADERANKIVLKP